MPNIDKSEKNVLPVSSDSYLPKTSNKNGNLGKAQNINQLHYVNNEFHNHHIVPPEKTERIFELKTTAESQPTIKVNIGRIEVRAVIESKPPPQRQMTRKPNLTLEDY